MAYQIPKLPLTGEIETRTVLKQLNASNRVLAELKGVALTIPNETILINTLALQEAKDSSAIENIVTTHDDLYRLDSAAKSMAVSAAAKEVHSYAVALKHGFQLVRKTKILSNSVIKEIQSMLEHNDAGFRKISGTSLKNQSGEIIYTPPQNPDEIEDYMANLEIFINNDDVSDLDPLTKMAIIHHQFESIHPFFDGNGRTGRIINILYLVVKDRLDIPILYLSRFIIKNKSEYYKLLQKVRDSNAWEEWILFILKGVEETARQTIYLVKQISTMMSEYKFKMRPAFGKVYRHELLNNLFNHPYTKIEFIMQDLGVKRLTAAKYLDMLVNEEYGMQLLEKIKIGRENYYLNTRLIDLFMNFSMSELDDDTETIASQ
jgi:Fic family protein